MIRLPKNYFKNLTPKQYREYLKLLPSLNSERAQLYTMIAFTLAALSFFGIFAINPTLTTIAELKKKYADLEFVHQKLIKKSQDLSILLNKYRALDPDLPIVLNAIPKRPDVPRFMGQVNALLKESSLEVKALKTYGIEMTEGRNTKLKKPIYFTFSVEALGTYENMMDFIKKISNIDRLVTIESVSISKDEKKGTLYLNLKARQYYMP